ncbi:hypothetical protein [Tuwongella immobilis]|uniref:Lipoprotein n=1 Tax=Tuwongella immobilis TaxID=692036 RepID=A0A6C2YIV0_9BACT|nr:hypothetical protein [Tuwongella immobilis]VIP01063.1 unnamed protein product [Tuwongella immobilis]VTR97551.1 unnamed protein product [Tuwongella immobilis]
MIRLIGLGVLLGILGCGSSTVPPTSSPRKMTWAEFQKMPPEDRNDPMLQQYLDDDAKKKLEAMRKRSK